MIIAPLKDPYALRQDGTAQLTADWDAGSYDIKALSFSIGDNKLTTDEWANLDGLDQALKTTDSPQFAYVNITDETNGYQIDGERVLSLYNSSSNVNIFIGVSGNFSMTGVHNLFCGYNCGIANTTGDDNFGWGYECLKANTEGADNLGIGFQALIANTTGDSNIGISGLSALNSNTTGSRNIAIGGGFTLVANTTGNDNIAIGYECLNNNITGNLNTSIGRAAGQGNVGNSCIFLGSYAGYRQTTASNILIIDNQDRGSSAEELGGCLIYGIFNATIANQSLTFNVSTVNVGVSGTTDPVINFRGSTNTGILTYDESDDEFDLGDADLTTTGQLGIGTAPLSNVGITNVFTVSSTTAIGFGNQLINTANNLAPAGYMYALSFSALWQPDLGAAANRTWGTMMGGYGVVGITLDANETKNYTINDGYGYRNQFRLTSATVEAGVAKYTDAFNFAAIDPFMNANSVITNLYAFYDDGMTQGTTNWGFYGLSTNNYLSGNLYFGQTDGAERIASNDDGHLDLIAGTSVDVNADLDISAKNIITDTSTGTKIGTSTSQLLGFYNATPVNQPDTVADASTQDLTGTDTIDQTKLESDLSGIVTAVNTIIDRLQELGLVA